MASERIGRLDAAGGLQEVAHHLRLAAREMPEGHERDLIDGHRAFLLRLASQMLDDSTPTPEARNGE